MNKEYIYVDGNVIIKDEKDNYKMTPYYDNISDVLKEENVVETIEIALNQFEKEKKKYEDVEDTKFFPSKVLFAIFASLSAPLLIYLSGDTTIFMETTSTIFGNISQWILDLMIVSSLIVPLSALIEVAEYNHHKNLLKAKQGVKTSIELLQKKLSVETKKLHEMKQEKTREHEDKSFRVVKFDDEESLNNFTTWLHLFYDLGYNEEKYFKCCKNGTLGKELEKHYTKEGIELGEKYFEEKGPELVKKYQEVSTKH